MSMNIFEQYENYPEVPGTAIGYATSVEFNPGPGTVLTSADNALGVPDNNAVPLGQGGTLIMGVAPFVISSDASVGGDFYIIEQGLLEEWDTFVSNDKINWQRVEYVYSKTNGSGTTRGYNVDGLENSEGGFAFVKVVDTSYSAGPSYAGADIVGMVVTSGKYNSGETIVDTDSDNGVVYNLIKRDGFGVTVKIIKSDLSVEYVDFSTDDSLEPVALSAQGNFHLSDTKDINVLAIRQSDGVPLNIIKDQQGNEILTIDNSVTK